MVLEVDNCDVVDGEVVRAAHKLLPTLPTVLVARIISRCLGEMRGCIVTTTLLLLPGSSLPLIWVAIADCKSTTSSSKVWIAES